MALSDEDLNQIEIELLSILTERPLTPTTAGPELEQRYDTDVSNQYRSEALSHLAEHGHLRNIGGLGAYVLASDPREPETIAEYNDSVVVDDDEAVWSGPAADWLRCPLCHSDDVRDTTDPARCNVCGLVSR